jgi:hypothetical protein
MAKERRTAIHSCGGRQVEAMDRLVLVNLGYEEVQLPRTSDFLYRSSTQFWPFGREYSKVRRSP